MIRRLREWLICLLISADQFLHMIFAGPKFVIFGGKRPNPDETISSRVGRAAILGKRWGLACEKIIDAPFRLLGQRGHCRASVEWSLFN